MFQISTANKFTALKEKKELKKKRLLLHYQFFTKLKLFLKGISFYRNCGAASVGE